MGFIALPPPRTSGSLAFPASGCTGSGTTWLCAAGATTTDISNVITNASSGATTTFQNGSYSWGSFTSFDNTKGMTFKCQSAGNCTVNVSGTVLGMNGNLSGTNNNFYRVSGFNFSGATTFVIFFWGPGTLSSFRIDHNTFSNATGGPILIHLGENGTVANFFGVIDHNTSTSAGSVTLLRQIGKLNPSPIASPMGTGNNVFVEDNTVMITAATDSGSGCVDSWGTNGMVVRHNTFKNCLSTAHGTYQNSGAIFNGGPQNVEFYNNNAITDASGSFPDGYRLFHHQGASEMIVFNNSFTAAVPLASRNSEVISLLHYRDYGTSFGTGVAQCDGTSTTAPFLDGNRLPLATNQGYPCWSQPGRDLATQNLFPIYTWNNFWSDTLTIVPLNMTDQNGGTPDFFSNHMQFGREAFDAVSASAQTSPTSPFNGTTGMGFGTLANRPTTCTTNTAENAFGKGTTGVGYFATDVGPQGTLYQCSATNIWTVYFTPFAYPHPLVT